MNRIEKCIGRDFQGWPIYKRTLREILVALCESNGTSYNDKDGTFTFTQEFLDTYPLLGEDDGMGYYPTTKYITEIHYPWFGIDSYHYLMYAYNKEDYETELIIWNYKHDKECFNHLFNYLKSCSFSEDFDLSWSEEYSTFKLNNIELHLTDDCFIVINQNPYLISYEELTKNYYL